MSSERPTPAPPDPEEIRRAVLALRTACDDADAITVDLLRPLRKRELGHAQHTRLYRDARKAIEDSTDYLERVLTLLVEALPSR